MFVLFPWPRRPCMAAPNVNSLPSYEEERRWEVLSGEEYESEAAGVLVAAGDLHYELVAELLHVHGMGTVCNRK